MTEIISEKTTHQMKLDHKYFQEVKYGLKTYEIRLFDDKRKTIKNDDEIVFTNSTNQENIKMKVLDIKIFLDFREAIDNTPLESVLPGIKNNEEAIEIYHNIPGYLEKVNLGVVRFLIEKCD